MNHQTDSSNASCTGDPLAWEGRWAQYPFLDPGIMMCCGSSKLPAQDAMISVGHGSGEDLLPNGK